MFSAENITSGSFRRYVFAAPPAATPAPAAAAPPAAAVPDENRPANAATEATTATPPRDAKMPTTAPPLVAADVLILQSLVQRSELSVLPSSHSSLPTTRLSPQTDWHS